MHRAWVRFDEMQKKWAAHEKELLEELERYKADSLVVDAMREENNDLRADLETAQNTASSATKEAKQLKEDLQTIRLDRDYQAGLADQKTSLVETL